MFNQLRQKYPEFIYESCKIEETAGELRAHYQYRLGELIFHPEVVIPKKQITTDYDKEYLHYLLFQYGLFDLMSYYKLTCSPKIVVKAGYINQEQADFFRKVLFNGLGEYFYRNDINTTIDGLVEYVCESSRPDYFPEQALAQKINPQGNLIPVGGGKDSVVALELLRPWRSESQPFMMDRNLYPDNKAGYDCIKLAGYEREQTVIFRNNFDLKLLELNRQNFLNGHIPFSAGLSMAARIMAYLTGHKYITLSNEASANEGNIGQSQTVENSEDGRDETPNGPNPNFNHQYSKSFEYEQDFRTYSAKYLNSEIEYFSLLRPWNEYQIIQEFVKFPQYLSAFRSCNRGMHENKWCNHCSKCLYVYIMLCPFLSKAQLLQIFDHDLLDDESLSGDFWGLVSDSEVKPFECVGTKAEINYALQQALAKIAPASRPKLLQEYADWQFCPVDRNEIENFWNSENFVPERYQAVLRQAIKKIQTQLTFAQKIMQKLAGKKVLILGFGREGKSTYDFIRQQNPDFAIGIADQNDLSHYNFLQKDQHVTLHSGKNYLQACEKYDVIIKAPGVPIKNHLSLAVKRKITCQIDLFLEFCPTVTIGVTGTKGKSTTASLMTHILQGAGKNALLVGNIGIPCFDKIAAAESANYVILEISAHQLEFATHSPHIAVLLNLFEEHLDHYNSFADYQTAKENIYRFQHSDDYALLPEGFPDFGKGTKIWLDSTKIPSQVQTNLIGQHNHYNIDVCLKIAQILQLDQNIVLEQVANFRGLPHRLEFVGEFNGVKFYDDSISTAVDSTISAIKALHKVHTIIIGGMDRGLDYTELVRFLVDSDTVKVVIMLPDTNIKLLQLFPASTPVKLYAVNDMPAAVAKAKEVTPAGEICLLSPAAASYNMYKNFEARGDDFKRLAAQA